jgi:hypothetical protein
MQLVRFTLQDIISWVPELDPRSYLPPNWTGTVLDVLRIKQIPEELRLQIVLRNTLLDDPTLRQFAIRVARIVEPLANSPASSKAISAAQTFVERQVGSIIPGGSCGLINDVTDFFGDAADFVNDQLAGIKEAADEVIDEYVTPTLEYIESSVEVAAQTYARAAASATAAASAELAAIDAATNGALSMTWSAVQPITLQLARQKQIDILVKIIERTQ